jgi:Skp family chaperone for outer membrane proteins
MIRVSPTNNLEAMKAYFRYSHFKICLRPLITVLVVPFFFTIGFTQGKTGHIDYAKVWENHSKAKALHASYVRDLQTAQIEFEEFLSEKQKAFYEEKLISDTSIEKIQAEFDGYREGLIKTHLNKIRKMEKDYGINMKEIADEIDGAVGDLKRINGYDTIVSTENNTTEGGEDVTDKIIEMLNK